MKFPGLIFARRSLIAMLAIGAAAAGVVHCGDSRKLAEFEGGGVTRGELRNLMQLSFGPEAKDQATTDLQSRILTDYALLKIAADEARKLGLQNSPEFKERSYRLDDQARLAAFNYSLVNNLEERKFKFYELQFIMLSSTRNAAGQAEPGSRTAEANDLIKEIESKNLDGEKLEDLIRDKTDQQRYRWLGGYLDPHCVSCRPDLMAFLTTAVKDAPEKKFVIVEQPDAVYILRKYREFEAEGADVEEVYGDFYTRVDGVAKRLTASLSAEERAQPFYQQILMSPDQRRELAKQQADRILRQESRSALNGLLQDLVTEKKVEFTALSQAQPNLNPADYTDDAVLYRMGDQPYTYGMLKKDLEGAPPSLDLPAQLQFMNTLLFPTRLLADNEDFKKIDGSDFYAWFKQLREDDALAGLYYDKQIQPRPVTDQEVAEWFELRRQTQYANKSLGQVQAEIRAQLEASERQKALEAVKARLSEERKLQILTDRLQANEL